MEEEYYTAKQSFLGTNENISKLADKYFPYKDASGNPQYRAHQKKAITDALQAYRDGYRNVIIDAPVGSGKSPINYTISMAMGTSVYLTPQKQLQDQIIKEEWSSTRMIKGRTAYTCNHIDKKAQKFPVTCGDDGKKHDMCRTEGIRKFSLTSNNSDNYIDTVKKSITTIQSKYKNNDRTRRKKTSFELTDNIDSLFTAILDRTRNDAEAASNNDEFSAVASIDMVKAIRKSIGCDMGPCECPVKSAKMLGKISKFRVLNPDVFYMILFYAPRFFGQIDLLTIDECHAMEDVIQRIMTVKLPIDLMEESTGVNFRNLAVPNKSPDEMAKAIVIMDLSHIAYLRALAAILRTSNIFEAMTTSQVKTEANNSNTALAESLRACTLGMTSIKTMPLEILIYAFADDSSRVQRELLPFYNLIRETVLGRDDINTLSYHIRPTFLDAAKQHLKDTSGRATITMPKIIERIKLVSDTVGDTMDKIRMLTDTKDNESRVFDTGVEDSKLHQAIMGTSLMKITTPAGRVDTVVTFTPIKISTLMYKFFFVKAGYSLLSTGTWTNLDSMMYIYGLGRKTTKYVKVPTTFNRVRRPIYILDTKDGMDFSKRVPGGRDYIYKTAGGVWEWTKQLDATIKGMRRYIQDKKGVEKPNMVIHSHTFELARLIARNGHGIDDSYLIHIGAKDIDIMNSHNYHVTKFRPKDDLVEEMMDRHDEGLTLVSASVSEGMDFKYGAARAQIILKKPTPHLGSIYVKSMHYGNKNLEMLPDMTYLDRVGLTTMTQQYGRVMRDATDWGYTVFFDKALATMFKNLLSPAGRYKRGKLNIDYMLEGIKGDKDKYGGPIFDWVF